MHTRPTFPPRAMHLPLHYYHEIYSFLDQWLFLCTCLFDVLRQWNFSLPSKPVLFKTINYHAVITRACSFGSAACAHLLFRVYTNYVITLSRTGTEIDGVSLCWVSKGMLGKRWSLGGVGLQRLWQGTAGFWQLGLQARSSSRDMVEVDAGAGWETANDPLISVQGDSLLFPRLLWRWGPMSLRDCRLCNLKVFKRAIRQHYLTVLVARRTDEEWQVGTRHLLFHWRGSETEGITVLCKVTQEVRAKQRVKAKLYEEGSLKKQRKSSSPTLLFNSISG